MKLILPKLWRWICCLHIGLLALVACLLLASTSLAQTADTSIVFISLRSDGRNSEIYRMNPDGKRLRRLTEQPGYDGAPAWSPDGQKIAFMSFRDEHRLQERAPIYGEIYLMNPDGTNPVNLTQSVERPDFGSSWSPDGKQIVFTSAEHFNWGPGLRKDIWVMDADGGNPRDLTNHDAEYRNPDWSPDGMQIAFESNRNKDWEFENSVIGNWEVFVMNADGANPINLTNNLAWDSSPDWSPAGDRIAFTSNRDGNSEVYVMNADGTNPINLTNHPAWDSSPSWESIRPLGVASNGQLVTSWGNVKRTNTYGGK